MPSAIIYTRTSTKDQNFGHLAQEAGINRNFLSSVMTGSILPSVTTAVALAYAASRLTQKNYTPDMFLTIAKGDTK